MTPTARLSSPEGGECQDARVTEADNTSQERRMGIESSDVGRQRKYPCP
jgi:hypothetical protein